MQLPDGPTVIPFLYSLKWRGRYLEFLERCAQRYGGIFTFKTANSRPYVVVSHPKAIEEIFTAPLKYFDSGRNNQAFRPLLGSKSLLLLDGGEHRCKRKLLMPPFHGERLQIYGQMIEDITRQEISHWSTNQPLIARPAVQIITLRIILRVLFGSQQEPQAQALNQCLTSLVNSFLSPFPWQLLFFSRQKQQLDELLYTQIQQRRQLADFSSPDILNLLLAACDNTGKPLSDEEIRGELITLIMAGYETTTTSVVWFLYWVAKLPKIQEKLVEELKSLGDSANVITLTELPYLCAVFSETLRIYSITGFTFDRIVKEPIKIMGYEFEPGTVLSPCTYLTHQREEIYPNPKQFKPERFLERQFSPYEYYPFGGSNRRCIGMSFAQFEIKIILATILSRLHLSLVDRQPVRPILRGINLIPPLNLRILAAKR